MLNIRKIFEKMMPPTGMDEETILIPALDARGYQFQYPDGWYPKYIPTAQIREKADFSKGPQTQWWREDKEKTRDRRARSHG